MEAFTAWKVPVATVFLVRIFPHGPEKLRIQTLFTQIFFLTIRAQLTNQNSEYVLSQNYPHLQGLNIAKTSKFFIWI